MVGQKTIKNNVIFLKKKTNSLPIPRAYYVLVVSFIWYYV